VVSANRQAVLEVEGRLPQQTDTLTTRIDDLQTMVEERMQETVLEQDRALDALRQDASRANILEALGIATCSGDRLGHGDGSGLP
jgi:hypothetical protein